MKYQALVIEDDESVRELLSFHLNKSGFDTFEAASAEAAWAFVSKVDVVVLDWMLPDESGVRWLQRLRAQEKGDLLPVLMLTAKASEVNKVEGLEAGADDYLVKPFSVMELVARIKALLRRSKVGHEQSVGSLIVNEAESTVTLKGSILQLTRREFELLNFLTKHVGRVFSRSDLLDKVWGEDFIGTERTVDQHIAQLRAIIGVNYLETVRGRGYKLVNVEEN